MYVTNTLCIHPTRYEYDKNFFFKTSIVQRTPAFYIHFHTLANTSRCDRAFTEKKVNTHGFFFNVVNKLWYITGDEGCGQVSSKLCVSEKKANVLGSNLPVDPL